MHTTGAGRLGWAMAAALLAAMPALAQGAGGENARPGFGEHRPPMEKAFGAQGEHGRFWNNPKVVERLKLTDDQRKAMDAIWLEHREKLVDLRGGVEKAELELEPMIREDQPNESRILAQIDKVAQARAELEKANARFLFALRAKLSPEQWKQVQAFRSEHGQEHPGWGAGEAGQNRQGPRGGRPNGEGQGGQNAQPPSPPPAPQGAGPGPAGDSGSGAEQ